MPISSKIQKIIDQLNYQKATTNMVNTFDLVFQNGSKDRSAVQVKEFIKKFKEENGVIDASVFNILKGWVSEKLNKSDDLNLESYNKITGYLASSMIEDKTWTIKLKLDTLKVIPKTKNSENKNSSNDDKEKNLANVDKEKIRTNFKKFIDHNKDKIIENAEKFAKNKFSDISAEISNVNKNKLNNSDVLNFSVNVMFILIGMILAFFMMNDLSSSVMKGPVNGSKTVEKVFN